MQVHYINAWVLVGPSEPDALESPVGQSVGRAKESSSISKLFKVTEDAPYYLQAPQDDSSKVKSQLLCAGHYIYTLYLQERGTVLSGSLWVLDVALATHGIQPLFIYQMS